MATNLSQTKWADHVTACAELANSIANKMDIRDDSARQAMLATIIISSDRHNIFMEPAPSSGKTAAGNSSPGTSPTGQVSGAEPKTGRETAGETAPTLPQRKTPPIGEVTGENQGAIKDPTPEQAEGANRTALLDGVNKTVKLLNQAGLAPPMTPKGLNAYIASELKLEGNLGSLDADELGTLLKSLTEKLDTLKTNAKALEGDGF